MTRPLLLAGIATFVAVDVLLVVLAVAKVRSTDAASSPVATSPVPSVQPPGQRTPGESAPTPDEVPRPRPVHLDIGSDDTLLRATPGDCQGEAAEVELSLDGGDTFDPVTSPVVEVLRVEVVTASDIWMVGLDEDCAVGFYRSADRGRTWHASAGSSGAWHLLASPAATVLATVLRLEVG
ncbi:MAG: hypothetical protein ACRD0P_20755 [Stackebrandtia sp.]